jgi:hypothetical protein
LKHLSDLLFSHKEGKLLLLVYFLVFFRDERTSLSADREREEKLDGIDGTHAGNFEAFPIITEEHFDCIIVLVFEVDVALKPAS